MDKPNNATGNMKNGIVIMNMPADWAIEEALLDIGSDRGVEDVKSHPKAYREVLIIARMIEKYEPHRKPVDPALVIVRELYASQYLYDNDYRNDVIKGDCDEYVGVSAMFAKYKELHP